MWLSDPACVLLISPPMLRELRLTYRFVWRDLSASLIPALLFISGAYTVRPERSLWDLAGVIGGGVAYFALYIYTFCVGNQIAGLEEDRINKPDRPLPSGLVSLRGAKARWVIANILFPLIAYVLGGVAITRWALAWQMIAISYNFLGLHRHWITKNFVFITLGTLVLMAAAWELVLPLSATAWRWILVISISFGATLHIQDLRDVAGDRHVGRRTFSLAIGDRRARVVLAAGIVALPIITHLFLTGDSWPSVPVVACELGLATVNFVCASRVLLLRTSRADHTTYMLHTYWFCAVLGSSVVVLPAARCAKEVPVAHRATRSV